MGSRGPIRLSVDGRFVDFRVRGNDGWVRGIALRQAQGERRGEEDSRQRAQRG